MNAISSLCFRLVVLFLLAGAVAPAAAADSFDSTSKVGAGYIDAPGTRFVCGLTSQPANAVLCACSTAGSAWTFSTALAALGTPYPASGLSAVPNTIVELSSRGFYVADDSASFRDEIQRIYIDDDCKLLAAANFPIPAAPPSYVTPSRIGPRLGIMRHAGGQLAHVSVFGVVPVTSVFGAGRVVELELVSQGNGAGTWRDVTGSVQAAGEATFPPMRIFHPSSLRGRRRGHRLPSTSRSSRCATRVETGFSLSPRCRWPVDPSGTHFH